MSLVDVWSRLWSADAALGCPELQQLLAPRVGGGYGVVLLHHVSDTEVAEDAQHPAPHVLRPLTVQIDQESVDLRDLHVDLLTGKGAALGRRDALLAAEAFGGASAKSQCERTGHDLLRIHVDPPVDTVQRNSRADQTRHLSSSWVPHRSETHGRPARDLEAA